MKISVSETMSVRLPLLPLFVVYKKNGRTLMYSFF